MKKGAGQAPFYYDRLLTGKNQARFEYRPIHTHPLHGRSLLSGDADGATGAAADSASHIFLQGDLARQMKLPCKGRDSTQHRRRAATEYFNFIQVLRLRG